MRSECDSEKRENLSSWLQMMTRLILESSEPETEACFKILTITTNKNWRKVFVKNSILSEENEYLETEKICYIKILFIQIHDHHAGTTVDIINKYSQYFLHVFIFY